MRLKKILAILLTVVLLVSSTVIALPVSAEENNAAWDGTVVKPGATGLDLSTVFQGRGSGTEADPYLISSAADLAKVAGATNNYNQDVVTKAAANKAHYKLTADIDLGNKEWYGIGDPWNTNGISYKFTGTFDGDGHVIHNLKLASGQAINGLFRVVEGATIKNIGIASGSSDINVGSTAARIGNLIGGSTSAASTISNCFNMASLTVKVSTSGGQFVGGLAGNLENGATITDCWNTGDITITMDAAANIATGGIAARVKGGTITNCHSNCDISIANAGQYSGVGSLIGKFDATGTVLNCSTGGTVNETTSSGADAFVNLFAGDVSDAENFTNCTYSTTSSSITNVIDNSTTGGITEGKCNMFVNNAVQNGTVDGNSIRFVTELTLGTAGFVKTGFKVSVTYNGATKSQPLEGAVVYSSLLADGETKKPDEGNVFIAYGISGIPADADATFTVTPYVVAADGTEFCGEEWSVVNMVDGDVPEQNA